jgi:proton glutamate symport protein
MNAAITRRPWYRPSLTTQIFIGLIVGGAIGYFRPDWGNAVYFLRDIFLNLIKSIIAPLVFSTIVVGIAGGGALKKVGRMGAKALIYFEIVTTAALFIGLAIVNLTRPGIGVVLATANTDVVKTIAQSHPKTLVETIVHAFPSSIVEAMVRGDVLQIVAFGVLFALAVSAIGEKGKPIVRAMESLSQVMFKFTNYVMMFAPIGVGAAMAHTVGTQGLGVLVNLGNLILSLYLALILFIVLVFGAVIAIVRIPVRQFIRAVREPAVLAFATTSSESALPKAMQAMERFGVPRHIVGFVMPTGYSLTSTAPRSISPWPAFVVRRRDLMMGFHMGWVSAPRSAMILTLMRTSKGVAAVPRASLAGIASHLEQFFSPLLPGLIGVAVIFGVDELSGMRGATCVNLDRQPSGDRCRRPMRGKARTTTAPRFSARQPKLSSISNRATSRSREAVRQG